MDVSIGWDAEVSGLHAELQAFSGEWTIVDDGLSTNGTYVNGSRRPPHHSPTPSDACLSRCAVHTATAAGSRRPPRTRRSPPSYSSASTRSGAATSLFTRS
ncbi:MAG: FHA domain-containing protein [Solirubrobacteraceae bacterium]